MSNLKRFPEHVGIDTHSLSEYVGLERLLENIRIERLSENIGLERLAGASPIRQVLRGCQIGQVLRDCQIGQVPLIYLCFTVFDNSPAMMTTSASFRASPLFCLAWIPLYRPNRPRAIPPRKHGIPISCKHHSNDTSVCHIKPFLSPSLFKNKPFLSFSLNFTDPWLHFVVLMYMIMLPLQPTVAVL